MALAFVGSVNFTLIRAEFNSEFNSTNGVESEIETRSASPIPESPESLLGPEKPFVKLRPAYPVKLVFLKMYKRNKHLSKCEVSCLEMPFFLSKIQRELCRPK